MCITLERRIKQADHTSWNGYTETAIIGGNVYYQKTIAQPWIKTNGKIVTLVQKQNNCS